MADTNLISLEDAFRLMLEGNTIEYYSKRDNACGILNVNTKVAYDYEFRYRNTKVIQPEHLQQVTEQFKELIIKKLGINEQVFDACFETRYDAEYKYGPRTSYIYRITQECIGFIAYCPCTEHYVSEYYHNQYGVTRHKSDDINKRTTGDRQCYYYSELYARFGVDLQRRWGRDTKVKSIILASTLPADTTPDNRIDISGYKYNYEVSYSVSVPTHGDIKEMANAASFYMKPLVDHFMLAMKHASWYFTLIHSGFEQAMVFRDRKVLNKSSHCNEHSSDLIWDVHEYYTGTSVTGLPNTPCISHAVSHSINYSIFYPFIERKKYPIIYITQLDHYGYPAHIVLEVSKLAICDEMDECTLEYFIQMYLELKYGKAIHH